MGGDFPKLDPFASETCLPLLYSYANIAAVDEIFPSTPSLAGVAEVNPLALTQLGAVEEWHRQVPYRGFLMLEWLRYSTSSDSPR